MTLSLRISKERIGDGAWYSLVLPYIGGNAVRASLNGVLLGSQGDFALGRSNIWNSAKVFPIPPNVLREANTVEIDTFCVYDAGLVKSPYVVEQTEQAGRLSWLLFFSESGIWVLSGCVLLLGFVTLSIGFTSFPRLNAKFYLGLAALGTALLLADFTTIPYLPTSLLVFKRCTAILRHISVAMFLLGYLKLLERKPGWFAAGFLVLQAACVTALLIPSTVIGLKNTYTYTYLSILPFPVYLAVLLYITRKSGKGHELLLFGVGVGLICSMHDALSSFFWPNAVMISHYSFVIMIITCFIFVVNDILQNYRQLMLERSRAESYREASMHDPLTHVFNRNVLPLIRSELRGPFAVVILDLDDFKSINDEYGHPVGDLVLLSVAGIMNAVLRKDDYVIRAGGDEFLAILPDCPLERVDSIVREITEQIALARIDPSGNPGEKGEDRYPLGGKTVVTYSASIGVAYYPDSARPTESQFQELVNEADNELYFEKGRRSR